MKIKIVRFGKHDWVSDMDKYVGGVYEATMRPDTEEDHHGNYLKVFDIAPSDNCEGACHWTWYSDAVEIVEE